MLDIMRNTPCTRVDIAFQIVTTQKSILVEIHRSLLRGVFRKAHNEIRAPLKTPAWEAKSTAVVSYLSHLSRDFYTLMSFEIRGKYEVR